MPQLFIETNLQRDSIPENFVKRAVIMIALILNRPEKLTVVSVQPDSLMSWGGTSEPCALTTVRAIGNLGIEENKAISKAISEFINDELGIPDDRMFIGFEDNNLADVGFKGTTFHELLSENDLASLVE